MEDASPELFRPTWQQALGRGVYLGALVAVVGLAVLISLWIVGAELPGWVWAMLAFGPPVLGAPIAVVAERRAEAEISAGGIRLSDGVARWDEVVDLRAERRGNRTVVSVYLESGASAQLRAPYSGEFFAADPRFEGKMFALSYLWRSHRFGGLPG
ncbi:MAG: hypothetical protein ABW022_03435 [Actinoplanes sp.]